MDSKDSSESERGLAGVKGDLRRRLATYGSDWRDGLHPKVVAATGFLFFACIAPAIAFGGLMAILTERSIGAIEMLVATAACGIGYAFIAGQPLTILGGTGPVLVFTGILYTACKQVDIGFLPTYGWVGLWTAFFVIALGLTGMSRFVSRLTRFTDEIFAALISIIYIYEAAANVLRAFPAPHVADDSALFGLVLALATFSIARFLTHLRQKPYLRRSMRELIADFGPTAAVLLMIFVRHTLPNVDIAALDVPVQFSTTSGRPWWVSLGAVPGWVPFASAVPAALVAVLVFLDQNVTVRIIQSPENALQKGSSYHWDLVVVGTLIGVCSLFGLPWLVAATVRSVNHVSALSTSDGSSTSPAGAGVLENRVSPLAVHALIALALLFTPLLREIPMPVLYGLFLYMGVTSMRGSQFFERLLLWLTDPKLYPERHYTRLVPNRVIHLFTAIQAACLVLLWVVKSSAVGILFPIFVALLVPVRSLLSRFISAEHLDQLDSEETLPEREDDFAGL